MYHKENTDIILELKIQLTSSFNEIIAFQK